METIYLDELFLINFIIDYFTLLCAGKVASAVLRRGRIALGALAGGAYACMCMVPGWGFLLHPAVKVASGVVLCLIAFGRETQLLRCVTVFFLVSAGFGGLVWAVSMLGGYQSPGSLVYLPLDWKVLVLSFAAAYAAISLLFRRFGTTARQEIRTARVELGGRCAEFSVLRDTGNSLYDPITNESVLVCRRDSLSPLFPGLDANWAGDPAAVMEALSRVPGLSGRVRLIPYSTVGQTGLLPAFRPDALFIGGQPAEDTLVAMTDTKFSTYGEYQGIY